MDARSVGIRDLRHGDLLETDWSAPDADTIGARRTRIPLHAGARHFVVLATVRGTSDSRLGRFLGDLLVRPDSAVGDTGDDDRLAYPEDAVCRLTGLHHFDLLNHPDVYTAIRSWLTDRPQSELAWAPWTCRTSEALGTDFVGIAAEFGEHKRDRGVL